MKQYQWVIVASLVLTTGVWASCLAQSAVPTENPIWTSCPPLPYRPESDSVARQATVDSIAAQLTGRWGLVEISSGWGPNHKPARSVEITINSQQQGLVNENGVEVARFQLTLSRRWNSILFKIEQQGQSVFHFTSFSRGHLGRIYTCGQKLILSDGMADGTAFAFRRIPDNAPVPPVDQHAVTALLNYVPWSGNAQAVAVPVSAGKGCAENRFTLRCESTQAYVSYPKNPTADSTLTAGYQSVTQRLRIAGIPLAVGRYELAKLDSCCISAGDTRFDLWAGTHPLETWQPNTVWSGWIEITRYDPATRRIAGLFDFYMLSPTGRCASFNYGAFTAALTD